MAGPKEGVRTPVVFSLIDSRSGRFLRNALGTTFLVCIGEGVFSVAASIKKSRAIFAVSDCLGRACGQEWIRI